MPEIFDNLEATERDEPKSVRAKGRPGRTKSVGRGGRRAVVRYGVKAAQAICDRLVRGETFYAMANTTGMPAHRTFYAWMDRHPEVRTAVETARRIAAESRFEEALEVARAATRDTVQADKLRVGLLMNQAAVLDPRRFGKGGPRGGAQDRAVRQITIRHFERAWREDGTEYVRVIDGVQDVEEPR